MRCEGINGHVYAGGDRCKRAASTEVAGKAACRFHAIEMRAVYMEHALEAIIALGKQLTDNDYEADGVAVQAIGTALMALEEVGYAPQIPEKYRRKLPSA